MTLDTVVVELGPVTIVRLNQPPMNLISGGLIDALDDALATIESDDRVRAVVLAASGDRAFSAGSDITEFLSLRGRVGEGKLIRENAVYDRLASLTVPTVAAIEGNALGGGLELALCCDLRVASKGARLGLPELQLGVIPGSGGTQRLPRLVGLARAKELILLSEIIDAEKALEIGLITKIAPDGAAETVAVQFAETLASRGPIAMRAAKRLLDETWGLTPGEGQAMELAASERVFASDDMEEGAAAFLEKRPAEFDNR